MTASISAFPAFRLTMAIATQFWPIWLSAVLVRLGGRIEDQPEDFTPAAL